MERHEIIMLVFSVCYVVLIYLLIQITWTLGMWPL